MTIRASVEPDGIVARCDRDRVTQVLVAFVDNAVKHCSPGDVVTVSATRRGEAVVLSVADTGTGIAPETLPRVFVEAHGSHISITSTVGAGTTFSFSLALADVGDHP